MSKVLTINDTTSDGLFQITDTAWDSNGTLRVTVREMVGHDCLDMTREHRIRRMRALARRAIDKPELTRSARLLREFQFYGCDAATFAVSRLERY